MRLFESILLVALLLGVEGFAVPSRRASLLAPPLRSSTGENAETETATLMSMIEKRDTVIQNLENELDDLESELRKKSTITVGDKKLENLEIEVAEKSNMLTKRDQLIENLEEEIVELEDQLKGAGKFKEKGIPMKGRKVVGDEDDWVDPLQDVQGSLVFHFGMTIRLFLITIFYRIPKFFLSFPKRFFK